MSTKSQRWISESLASNGVWELSTHEECWRALQPIDELTSGLMSWHVGTMARLKPSTSKAISKLTKELIKIADAIEPALPFLAGVYRRLAEAMSPSIPGAPFEFYPPAGSSAEIVDGMVVVHPPDEGGTTNDDVTTELRRIADDIEPARPLLGALYRNIAEPLESSLSSAPFRFRIPDGATAEHHGYCITIYPHDYDHFDFQTRLRKVDMLGVILPKIWLECGS